MTIPKLGIFFIVVAFLLTIPAFRSLSKTTEETEYEGLRDSVVSIISEYIEARGLVTTEDRSRASNLAYEYIRKYRDKCDELATKRHIKSACWFVPAGILVVLGLVLKATGKPNT